MSNPKMVDDRVLRKESELRDLVNQIKALLGSDGITEISVGSWVESGQRWARNKASLTSGREDTAIYIYRGMRGSQARLFMNQIDKESLVAATGYLESSLKEKGSSQSLDLMIDKPSWESKGIVVWDNATFKRNAIDNGPAVVDVTNRSVEKGFLSAGYIETKALNAVKFEKDLWGRETFEFGTATQGQCSVTIRNGNGTGSGWAGVSSFNINLVDFKTLSDRAFNKCLESIDPVRIEPGRYQTILQPQAAFTLIDILVGVLARDNPEYGQPGPVFLEADQTIQRFRSKLGLKLVDSKVTIRHDPTDPVFGTHVSEGIDKVTLIERGVLVGLYSNYSRTIHELTETTFDKSRRSYVMDGDGVTTDEMIATTERGLLATRFDQAGMLDRDSLLCTGLTRDGLWLIENGKITKAVRNFRWTESPLFILNNLVQTGVSEPVFNPIRSRSLTDAFHNWTAAISVPTIKVNDFSFTSTIDAV